MKGVHIEPAEGKLGVLLVGLGAVSTTFTLHAPTEDDSQLRNV